MATDRAPIQYVLTLPSRMAAQFEQLEGRPRPLWFATSDPQGRKLGSGGGTAHALAAAWQETGQGRTFSEWLRESRKLVLHGGGQSRRLPAYGPAGKILMPMPVFRWSRGQRLDQSLLDAQLPDYQRVLSHAGPGMVAMIASGDVMLRFGRELPAFPEVDVLGLGMWVAPEKARDFGVFFSPRTQPSELAFFLQKPAPERIREFTQDYLCLVDTGMWLLSERAVAVLMERCGWDGRRETFEPAARAYELYAEFGLSLGSKPAAADAAVNALTCGVVALPEAGFYHFGTSAQLVESASALQNIELDQTKLGLMGAKRSPDQHVLNSQFEYPLRVEGNHTLWVENSVVPKSWSLACNHVLTGVPPNTWDLKLEPDVCLDFVPVGARDFGVRFYGFRDSFSGRIGEAQTLWMGRPLAQWFLGRGLSLADAGLDPGLDIQEAPLFPVRGLAGLNPRYLEWLFAHAPEANLEFARKWVREPRISAAALSEQVNLDRLYRQRTQRREACLPALLANGRHSVFFRLDLKATAELYARSRQALPAHEAGSFGSPMATVHSEMFRAAVLRGRRAGGWQKHEEAAFATLREMIIGEARLSPATPRRRVLDDQIVWARSPVRLDLAGGWTDTPPYCIEHGGRVLNVAVDLNGQPPIQVFGKLCDRPELVVRSIDLGVEERIRTYEELDRFSSPGSGFALAKAGLALAGFLPRFHSEGGAQSLEAQLREFGGGLEISMLSAVPKGSGLGTSSILASTLLAALSELCGLGWDRTVLFSRTLALEQMLTTGGGWQDQAGGIFRGVKLIETAPGLSQAPVLRWLPEHLFQHEYANRTALLYYTGITRLAKDILREIVRGIFLNSAAHLRIIGGIGENAELAASAIQRDDYPGLVRCVRRSWELNQELDPGTNPPAVQEIWGQIGDWVEGGKLLGAGGGGYLLLYAKDPEAAQRIRRRLTDAPPNDKARFVELSVSDSGLQVTRS